MSWRYKYRVIYKGEGYMPQVRGGWWPFWRNMAAWERGRLKDAEDLCRWHAECAAKRARKGVVKYVEVSK